MTRKPKKSKTVTWEEYFEGVKKQLGKKEFDKWFKANEDYLGSLNPKQKITFDDGGDREVILNAQKNAEKEFDELLKDYKPYDLSEITKLILDVQDKTKGDKLEDKIVAYKITLNQIDSIFHNSAIFMEKFEDNHEFDIEIYNDLIRIVL